MALTPDNIGDYKNEYSDSSFWSKIKKILGSVGGEVIYNALLLYYVMEDENTPIIHKTLIIGALGYLILPIDIIPDFIPVVGYADDCGALAATIKIVLDSITPAIRVKANEKFKELLGYSFDKSLDELVNINTAAESIKDGEALEDVLKTYKAEDYNDPENIKNITAKVMRLVAAQPIVSRHSKQSSADCVALAKSIANKW